MTPLQQYILANGLTTIESELGIKVYESGNLLGFKYNQIDSPKAHDVVMWSRGTVLEKDTYKLVAQPFKRFFNFGEQLAITDNFVWDQPFTCTTKEDGSLIIMYFYDGQWRMNTSGSFAQTELNFSGKTWEEYFWSVCKLDLSKMNTAYTYVFEMCSLENKIVRMYREPKVFLLGITDNATVTELPFSEVQKTDIGCEVVECYPHLDTKEKVLAALAEFESKDPTFEGFVLRDINGLRIKLKSKTYVALHHMNDNGNLANPKRIVPFVIRGETDELVAYFPEFKDRIAAVQAAIDAEYAVLLPLYEATKDIAVQKDFALAIQGKTRFTGVLFTARKLNKHVKDVWTQSEDAIIKVMYS